ncbi:MAG: ABC transporter permease [Candidatus Pacearchaeota archaeon]
MRDYFKYALKNLRSRGVRSWLTLLGICIGIATVVSLISLGSGLKTAVNAQFSVSSTQVITVEAGGVTGFGPPGTGVADPLTQDDADAIRRLSSVEVVASQYVETAGVEFNNKKSFLSIGSIPDNEKAIEFIYDNYGIEIDSGSFIEEGEENKVLIGADVANGQKNDFGKDARTGQDLNIGGKDFKIDGVIKKQGSFIVDGTIFMKEDDLVELKNLSDEVDSIYVKVKNKELIDKAKKEIEKLLRERRDVEKGNENFEVTTPEGSLSQVNQIISGIQIFIIIIASISILVGIIGISNTMTTSVIERRREIGIMKAIGARNSNIFYQFLVESGMLGVFGGIIGVIIGVAVGFIGTSAINSFIGATTEPQINFTLIFFSILGSFVIGAVSGVTPSLKAAKLDPVDAIRE